MNGGAFASAMSTPRTAALDSPRLYDGVRTRRIVSFLVDYAVVALLLIPASIVVGFLGLFTLGLGWGLYAILPAMVALPYVAFTMGGRGQATPGMLMAGLRVARLDGQPVEPVVAAAHGVLFWGTVTLLTPFVLVVGLMTGRKQLLHDLALGTVVVRSRV